MGVEGVSRGELCLGGISPGEAAPGESRRGRHEAPFLPSISPPTEEEGEGEGRRERRPRKNNNEITITKANTGAHSLAAPEPAANKRSPLFAR